MSDYIEVDGLRVGPCVWRSKVEEVERLQARVAELVAVAVSVRDDLLLRSEIDSDGTRCVNLSASKWSSFCDVIDDNNSEAFITRKQAEAVQASRRAISSCSEIPNSSDPASRQAVSVPEWTDINLRQPEEYQDVLWFCQGGNIRTGMYYGKTHCDRVPETHPISRRGRSHYGKFGRYADPAESGHVVTHWMPLPQPPKQEGE